jgi:hypothetical protein
MVMDNKVKVNKKEILLKVEKYYVFSSFLNYLLNALPLDYSKIYDKALYTAFSAYTQSSISYLLSLYDDLLADDYYLFKKASANRILLRNCFESFLILNILENHPEYAVDYFLTFESDKERIKNLYLEDDDQEKLDKKRFLKRFQWLPRYKGKKARSISDLLNYIEFEDPDQKRFYHIMIRNFDISIHPSFDYVLALTGKSNVSNEQLINGVFQEEGLYEQASVNILSLFGSIFRNIVNPNLVLALKIILAGFEPNPVEDILNLKGILNLKLKNEDLETFVSKVFNTFNIKDRFESINKVPEYVKNLSYGIEDLSDIILDASRVSYKARTISTLLKDIAPRFGDMNYAVYEANAIKFYAQARHVLESFAMINALLNEEDDRSYIYSIHLRVKAYEARIGAADFINSIQLEEKTIISPEEIQNEYQNDIQIIKQYYFKKFNKLVDEKDLTRLNGWALFLSKTKNETVPNSPYFVEMLARDLFSLESEEIASSILALYEEANAFTHVTPYAFLKNQKFDLEKSLLMVNDIGVRLINNLMTEFKIKELLIEEELKDLDTTLFDALSKIKKNLEKKPKSGKGEK